MPGPPQCRHPLGVPIEHGVDHRRRGLSVEGRLAGGQLVEEAAECPDVRRRVGGAALQLLGCHIPEGSHRSAGLRHADGVVAARLP